MCNSILSSAMYLARAFSNSDVNNSMSTPTSHLPNAASSRWFYSLASLSLLVLMFIGFQLFYLQGKSFPGRPLTPPIRTFIIVHGSLMTAWMLLAVVQPLLVGTGRKRLHMKFGMFGVALAASMILVGVRI